LSDSFPHSSQSAPASPGEYVVIARRYRPQGFADLIGQEHIAQALGNAITTDRVGHAYLFTGARGVGKTSAARILAKALNCKTGPTPTPCNQCDICQAISSGDDVDVLEIDGASNRGIDEIRQLRQNVSIRPSRTRLKIYIIDEVHMLTREAFNALLKTLEEPPEHVKFIFCTTEPGKIPATILSRCQRFDFAGIQWDSIAECLRKIAEAEGVVVEPEALQVLARQAAGSMRDGQSLLEQLLAFSADKITVAHVHGMLGTAGEERLLKLLTALVDRDAKAALEEVDSAANEGVDLGQLLEQLFGYLRDAMAAVLGCPAESLLFASPSGHAAVAEVGGRLGLQTMLAAMQILDQTLSRLRFSTQNRTLAELALVRICNLEDLEELSKLIAELQGDPPENPGPDRRSGRPAPPRVSTTSPSRKAGPAVQPGGRRSSGPTPSELGGADPGTPEGAAEKATAPAGGDRLVLTAENAVEIWNRVVSKLSGMAAEQAKGYRSVAISAPNHLVVTLKPEYTFAKSVFETPEQSAKVQQALAEITGHAVRVEFALPQDPPADAPGESAAKVVSQAQLTAEASENSMIHRATELFGGEVARVEPPTDK
jgi:DNA polymerase-3 subunit gamma/tau